jgi:hypothetical protein
MAATYGSSGSFGSPGVNSSYHHSKTIGPPGRYSLSGASVYKPPGASRTSTAPSSAARTTAPAGGGGSSQSVLGGFFGNLFRRN